jgi:predicted branched-subunit amino acid permease
MFSPETGKAVSMPAWHSSDKIREIQMSSTAEAPQISTQDARLIEHAAFKEGRRLSAPTWLAIIAWGMVAGMTMVKCGLTVWQALCMTFIVYGGSSILAAAPLMSVHAPLWLLLFTAIMVNLRFVIFGAIVAPHFTHLSLWRRLQLGYINSDVVMSFFPVRYPLRTQHRPLGKEGFYTGVCYSGWVTWQIGTVMGIVMAGQIPESWNIAFAGTLALLALLIPMALNWPAFSGVVVASAIAVATHAVP